MTPDEYFSTDERDQIAEALALKMEAWIEAAADQRAWDLFAAAGINGCIIGRCFANVGWSADEIVKGPADYADAMIVERAKRIEARKAATK